MWDDDIGMVHEWHRSAGRLKPGENVWLYVGKAKRLRNRLMPSQHRMWEKIRNDPFFTDEHHFARLRIAVWYIDEESERKAAEAFLIKRFQPFLNTVNEGEANWQWRPPDAPSIDPTWIDSRSREECLDFFGEDYTDTVDHRPGVYGWYLEYEWWSDAAENSAEFKENAAQDQEAMAACIQDTMAPPAPRRQLMLWD